MLYNLGAAIKENLAVRPTMYPPPWCSLFSSLDFFTECQYCKEKYDVNRSWKGSAWCQYVNCALFQFLVCKQHETKGIPGRIFMFCISKQSRKTFSLFHSILANSFVILQQKSKNDNASLVLFVGFFVFLGFIRYSAEQIFKPGNYKSEPFVIWEFVKVTEQQCFCFM